MSKASPGPWSWGAGRGKWVLTDANNKPMLSFSEWSIEPGDMPLIAAAPAMAEMLRSLEWVTWGDDGPQYTTCPVCDAGKPGPHAPDCALAALLKDIP